MARSTSLQTPARKDNIFIKNTPKARGNDPINGIEAENRTLKGFIIKGLKSDKYYGDRKKLEH